MPVFKTDLHVLGAIAGVVLLSLLWQIWMAASLQTRFDRMQDDVQAEAKVLFSEIRSLKGTVEALRTQIVALEGKVGAPATAPDQLGARVAALDVKTAAVQEALATAVSELKAETGGINSELSELQTAVTEVKTGVGDTKAAQGEVLAAANELRADLGAAKTAQNEVQSAVSGLKTEMDAAKAGQETLLAAVSDLTKALQERAPAAALPPVAASKTDTFRIFFADRGSFGGGWLREEVAKRVADINALVGGRKDCSIVAEGHSDTVGPDAVNIALSRRRAMSVTDLLRDMMPDAAIGEPIWAGERRLLVATPDRTSEPKNRRVDITVRCGGA